MATFAWKLGTSLDPKIVLREADGCIVLSSYVDEDGNTILLTLPKSCWSDLAVTRMESGSLELEDREVTFSDTEFDSGLED